MNTSFSALSLIYYINVFHWFVTRRLIIVIKQKTRSIDVFTRLNPLFHDVTRKAHRLQLVITLKINLKKL